MEFRFSSDEERDASRRRGYVGTGGAASPAPVWGTIERELLKRRIREELIAREMAQLEEEVRRELAAERELAVRRRFLAQMQLGASAGGRLVPDLVLVPPPPPPPPYVLEARKETLHAEPKVPSKAECSLLPEIEPSNPNVVGTKRKAPAGTIEWICSLCEVSYASMVGLDEHFQGEEHQANLASKNKSNSHSMAEEKKSLVEKSVSAIGPANGKVKRVKKKRTQKNIWCELCNVSCNSEVMMAVHLQGKKHIARLESSKKRIDGASSAYSAAEEKEVTDEAAKKDESGEYHPDNKVGDVIQVAHSDKEWM